LQFFWKAFIFFVLGYMCLVDEKNFFSNLQHHFSLDIKIFL